MSIEPEVTIARKKDGLRLTSSNDVFVVEPLFQTHGSMEFYRGYIQPLGQYFSEAHQHGVIEYVTVMAGRLTVEVDGNTYHLDEHDSIRFRADRSHKYVNPSETLTILHFVISYNNR
ncbi:cupin [Bacillus solimangrovi]|uniref:Cupin n=1 Tax=Bacillus solimangrovi TaxID=1305675 RepID=A0A1E5LG10_9BACI|nr:cupin [Bacillus solimangrovi]